MKKRRLFYFLVVVCALFSPDLLKATHYMGGNVYYDCTRNGSTLEVYLSLYLDCGGAGTSVPPNVPSNVTTANLGGLACSSPRLQRAWQVEHYVDVTQVCPGTATSCNTSPFGSTAPIRGVLELLYSAHFDLFTNGGCTKFKITWASIARNLIITSGASNSQISFGSDVDITVTPCNNSPRFLNPPVAFICAGSPARYNHQAYDPDGDSLVFELDSCWIFYTSGAVPYNLGYSPTQPLGTSWAVTIDPQSGVIDLTPQPGNMEVGVVCVKVSEYRNGVFLSSTSRDMQFVVTNCLANNNPRVNQLTVLGGANRKGPYVLEGAIGVPMSFSLQVLDPDVGDTITSVFENKPANILGFGYSISGSNPQLVTANWTPQANGIYVLQLVSRDQTCPIPSVGSQTIMVEIKAFTAIGNLTHTPCDSSFGAIDLTPVGGLQPLQYMWSNGSTTQDISGLATGSYSVTIVDRRNDTIRRTFFIDGANILLNETIIDTSCNTGNSIQLNVSGGTPPYRYQWNTGDSAASLLRLSASAGYSVRVTDAAGCPRHGAWSLSGPDSCFNYVQGCVFVDENNNCVQDSGEIPMPNARVSLRKAGIATLTDSNGYYTLISPLIGLDTLQLHETLFLQATCMNNGMDTIRFDSLGITHDYKIGVKPDTIKDLVAFRFPSGARPGRSTFINLYARNDGGKVTDGTIRWHYDSIFTMTGSSVPFTRHDLANRVLEWDFTQLPPGQRFHVSTVMRTSSSVTFGDPYMDTLFIDSIQCDDLPQNNVMPYSDAIITSFDPNDKQAWPSQRLGAGWIFQKETMLNYHIRFQNTGNDTAFYVSILDTLDTNTLDIYSMKMIGASHPYSLRILNKNILEFTFENILLPDSATDREASQGYVGFSINRFKTLPPNTQIPNRAAIYFDFNEPVITNNALRTIYGKMQVSAPDSVIACSRDIIDLTAQYGASPFTFSWSDGHIESNNYSGFSRRSLDSSGFYSVVIADALGFDTLVSFPADISPSPDASFTVEYPPSGGVSFTGLPDHDSWYWNFGDGSIGRGRLKNRQYQRSGLYQVRLIVDNDCGKDTSYQWVNVLYVGLDQSGDFQSVSLSPNPMQQQSIIRFDNSGASPVNLDIFDFQGKLIRSYPSTLGQHFTIEKGNMRPGIYLYRLSGASKQHYGKFNVE